MPFDDRVWIQENDETSGRCGDAPVVGAGETEVLFVPDQTHGRRKLGRLDAVVVHDNGLEVLVAGRI